MKPWKLGSLHQPAKKADRGFVEVYEASMKKKTKGKKPKRYPGY